MLEKTQDYIERLCLRTRQDSPRRAGGSQKSGYNCCCSCDTVPNEWMDELSQRDRKEKRIGGSRAKDVEVEENSTDKQRINLHNLCMEKNIYLTLFLVREWGPNNMNIHTVLHHFWSLIITQAQQHTISPPAAQLLDSLIPDFDFPAHFSNVSLIWIYWTQMTSTFPLYKKTARIKQINNRTQGSSGPLVFRNTQISVFFWSFVLEKLIKSLSEFITLTNEWN